MLRIEDNTAVLINDFETNHARVEFGPAKVMLRPYEDVTVLDLSGSTPKRPRQLKVLMLRLGPDFATDLFEVATRDHARLRIKLSYKWQFDVEGDSEKDKAIFRVNDFIGYVCENLASRIRQVAAENDFETFHKNASVLIRRAIFGVDEAGKARKDRLFSENQLRIIDIDIKDIAPVDDKTALKLREAIDTNIQIQLDASKQEAQASAELKRIRSEEEKQLADISSHRKAEAERQSLIELQNKNHQLSTLSHAKVGAEAQLEKARVESEEALARAEAEARASRIRTEAELERERKMSEVALERQKRLNDLEVDRQARLTAVEADQFRQRVEALGGGENFVKAVAAQAQAAVVGGLDKVVFLPSGSNLNLFDSMQGLLGPGGRPVAAGRRGPAAPTEVRRHLPNTGQEGPPRGLPGGLSRIKPFPWPLLKSTCESGSCSPTSTSFCRAPSPTSGCSSAWSIMRAGRSSTSISSWHISRTGTSGTRHGPRSGFDGGCGAQGVG